MLSEQLSAQKEQLIQLITLLEKERLLLKARNILELEPLIAQKQQLLQDIANIDKEISDNTNERSLIVKNGQLYPQRQELEELLSKCKAQNELNGKVISLSLESNNRFSNLLNNALNRNNITYDNKGKTHTSPQLGSGLKA